MLKRIIIFPLFFPLQNPQFLILFKNLNETKVVLSPEVNQTRLFKCAKFSGNYETL